MLVKSVVTPLECPVHSICLQECIIEYVDGIPTRGVATGYEEVLHVYHKRQTNFSRRFEDA
jgi:hypothetical protein